MTDPNSSAEVIDRTGVLSWLDLELEREREGRVVLSLQHRAELTNIGGNAIHGGIIATMIDNAAACALRTTLSEPKAFTYATTDLNVSYLHPATGDLRAEATVRRHGRSMTVVSVDIQAQTEPDEWTEVAVGRATFFVKPADEAQKG